MSSSNNMIRRRQLKRPDAAADRASMNAGGIGVTRQRVLDTSAYQESTTISSINEESSAELIDAAEGSMSMMSITGSSQEVFAIPGYAMDSSSKDLVLAEFDAFESSTIDEGEDEIVQSELVLIGYDNGEPIYEEKPCVSNDNEDPYAWNCTDAPTLSPTYIPVKDDMERDSYDTGTISGGGSANHHGTGGISSGMQGSHISGGPDSSFDNGPDSSFDGGPGSSYGSFDDGSASLERPDSSGGSGDYGSSMDWLGASDDSDEVTGDIAGIIIPTPSVGSDTNSTVDQTVMGNVMASNSTEIEEEADDDAASYTYKCTEELYCNSYAPGNSMGLGWTFNGTCVEEVDCPPSFNETKAEAEKYVEGDMTMVTSDYLNEKVIGSISCPTAPQGDDADEEEDDGTVLVPYVYEVETSQQVSDANIFLPRLEEQILLNLADGMMSCFSRRRLQEGSLSLRRGLEDETSAEYYVKGIESKPEDMAVTEGPCTISSPETDNCFVIDGRLTLLLDPTQGNANYNSTESAIAATDAAQKSLQESMANDDLLSYNMPEVIKVRYLADSYDDFLAGFIGQDSDLAAGGGDAAGGIVMDGNGMISDDNQKGDDGGGGFLWGMLGGILGAVLCAAMIMVCALLLVKRRRVKQYKEDEAERNARMAKEYDSQAVGMDFDWDEWDESFDNMSDVNDGDAGLGGGANGEVVLHVGGLGPNTTSEQIRELFEQHGAVSNCIVPSDHSRQRENATERFALLTMPASNEAEMAEAESACNHVNGLELEDGNVLSVREVSTLYVGNLSPNTTEEDVYGLFEQHGMVTGCIVPADHEGGPSNTRGRFALVTMPVDDAQSAETLVHGMEVDGYELTVRDIKYMNGGKGLPGGALAAAALAAGAVGAVAAFNAQGNEEVALHVGNLSPGTTEGTIRELFGQHGTVLDCVLPTIEEEGGNGTSRSGYALVKMPAEEAFNACNAINGMVVDGRRLSVREARQYAGAGRSGWKGGNLLDDSSSTFDNSQGYDAAYSRLNRSPNGDGEDHEEPPGVRSALKAMGGFMGGLFLFKPCRKHSHNDEQLARLGSITGRDYAVHASPSDAEKSINDGLDAIIQHIDSTTDLEDRRNFVVDPPGAFHLGNHHYTKDGVRYYSPLCEQCIAAQADEDGVVALKVISEEDDDESGSFPNIGGGATSEDSGNDLSFDLEAATKFTDFNSNDLGRFHSSMHVRHCKSTTCNICAKEKGVFFVKSRMELSASGGGNSSPRREAML